METFHVYVVGAVEGGQDALAKLAESMAGRYGLPPDDLLGRLNRGRFRVKAGVDRATADTLRRDLEQLGARVQIDDATGASEPAAKRASTPPPVRTSTPPPFGAQHPRASTPPPVGSLQSGLSAAFSQTADADLGALEQLANLDNVSLASVDGRDTGSQKALPGSFAPPGGMMSASIGPAAPPPATGAAAPPAAKPAKAMTGPSEFAPPDEGAELRVDIAPDEIAHRQRKADDARKRSTTPPAGVAQAPAVVPTKPGSAPKITPRPTPVPAAAQPVTVLRRSRLGPLGDERVRFAVGVVVAIAIGFLPAHFIASSWERSSYGHIDGQVESQQDAVQTADDWAALDVFRDRMADKKRDDRRSIAIVGMLVWAAAGAGIAYAWFRRVPWDRLDA